MPPSQSVSIYEAVQRYDLADLRCRELEMHPLPLAQIHPQIHIAHQLRGDLSLRPRAIVDWECIFIVAGQARLESPELGATDLVPGSLLVVPPFAEHRLIDTGSVEGQHIAVHFDLAPGMPDAGDVAAIVHRGDDGRTLRPIIDEYPAIAGVYPQIGHYLRRKLQAAAECHRHDDAISAAVGSIKMQEVLLHIIRVRFGIAVGQGAGFDREVQDAISYIETHFASPIALADLVRRSGLSRSRFSERFQKATGESPMRYLRAYRIERARQLLLESDCDIARVAEACGFADPLHFSKIFRAVDGRSPSGFRSEHARTQRASAL